MPRIPDDVIARLKREVDLKGVVERSGVVLRRQGKDWVGVCPLHEDGEASLSVNPEKGSWHCFGCDRGGSVIDWTMASTGADFRAAVLELVARHLPGAEVGEGPTASRNPVEPLAKAEVERLLALSDADLLRWVVELYCERGKVGGKAAAYLSGRGLAHPELLERFRIGVADRTLGLMLPAKALKVGAAIRARLQGLGVLRADTGHEHLNGRLVIPVFDAAGEVTQIYGRVILTNLRVGTPDHLYLPAPQRGIWNRAALASREVILCESLLDALSFWCAGFAHVTATFGANGWNDELREAILGHGVERVLVAFDADDAGDRGAAVVAEALGREGVGCWRVAFPRGMDANAYAQKTKPAGKALDFLLRHATWMGAGPALELPAADVAVEVTEEPLASFLAAPSLAGAAPAAPAALASVPASVLPARPPSSMPVERHGEDVVITLADRVFRVRGLAKNLSFEVLKVNLLARRGEAFHLDTLDLCSSRQRAAFAKHGAVELGMKEETLLHDLGRVYLALEGLQEEAIRAAQTPKDPTPAMTADEQAAALELLSDPRLLERIVEDLERVGLIGEAVNKLVSYLVAISRKLPKPLGVLIQSSTAAGKSSLMRAVLDLVPEEDRVAYSAMTGQSLFYMAEKDLRHKVLAIAEEEGAEKASYALKLLMSEGELSIASTGKDPQSGRLVTHEYHVEGPVAVLSTTTSIDVDEELLNRCIVLTVDEDREQTRAIHAAQRKSLTLAGQAEASTRREVVALHQNAQRLLRPLLVDFPFAERLTFPDSSARLRRDHEKYLRLIRTVALLFQHQREIKTATIGGQAVEYVDATAADVAIANELARVVLGRSLDDLPPQARRLLVLVDRLVKQRSEELAIPRSEVRLTRRDVRLASGWGQSQLAVHLGRLETLEYLIAHRGARGQTFVYELAYEAGPGAERVVLAGLLDAKALGYDGNLPGFLVDLPASVIEFPVPFRPHSGPIPGGFRDEQTPAKPGVLRRFESHASRNRTYGSQRKNRRRSPDLS